MARILRSVWFITGCSTGFGRELARQLIVAGKQVVITARDVAKVADLVALAPDNTLALSLNVDRPAEIEAAVSAALARFGRIDVLINNAGGSPAADAATASPRFSESVIALNLLGPLHAAQACHRWMGAGGAIVNIASVSAIRPSPGTAAYAAAKAGLLGLSRSLAQEWAPLIRVNAIIAGLIATEQAAHTYGSPAAQTAVAASVPLARLGTGADIAQAALFLASPLASFISGAELAVHGGGERPPFLDIVKAHAHG